MSFSATLKPKEVETPLDLWFFRPLAYLVVRLVWPTPISANQLTGMSLVTGVFASLCFLSTSPEWVRAGVGLMLFYAVLDCADGQLARARGTSSRFGRILDGSSDYLVGVLSTATLGWHLWQLHGLWGVVSVGVGMSAFGIQAVAYDGYKNRFLALSASQVR